MCWQPPRTLGELSPVQRDALALDDALVRVARGCGAIELAIGRTLDRLFRGDRLLQLCYSCEADYARERLGVPPRTMFLWLRLARGLEGRPLLERAVVAGAVSPRKALALLPVATGDDEAAWTEAATRLTVREIRGAVRAAGKEAPEDRFEADTVLLPMTPSQQDRLDSALALAKETIGPAARRWQCLEAICEEWLSSFGEHEGRGPRGPEPRAPGRAKVVARQLAAVEEALEAIADVDREAPLGDDALGLEGRALRLLAARRRFDEAFGLLADRARSSMVHETLGYRSFEEYCEERLGMSGRTVRERVWLERRMCELPELRQALASGRLSFSKAILVARHATPFDVSERIARAASTTWQQTEKECGAEGDRRDRAAGRRRVWAPADAAQTVWDAIASAQAWSVATRGESIGAGEALAVVSDHFVEVWTANLPQNHGHHCLRRREVLTRKGGLCSMPGCSRPAHHVHHVVFRSRGGPDAPWNEVGICPAHHLHGIHLGWLEVTGRAGERLHWRFGPGDAVPLEEWITFGDDDVRRADAVAEGHAEGRWTVACG